MIAVRLFITCVLTVGCGRIGFGQTSADGGGDDAPTSSTTGPRYMIILDYNAKTALVAGDRGEVAVAEGFTAATTIAGEAIAGHAMFETWGLVWFDPTGTPTATSTLDSTSICELRELAAADHAVTAAGFAQAGATVPAYGACAIATNHQEGLAIRVDPTGAQEVGAHLISSSFNTQVWHATPFDDGSIGVSGVYGGIGKFGAIALPMAGTDENDYYARIDPATGTPRWTVAVVSADEIAAGPIAANGDEACLIGEFTGTVTVLGTMMSSHGGNDNWVARVDSTGAPRWVRQVGSTGDESITANSTVVANGDGGCTAALTASGDIALDSLSLPVANGGAIAVRFDASGTAIAGVRTPNVLQLARVGETVYAALACTQPCTIGGATYTPTASDIAMFSFDDQLVGTIVAGLAGGATAIDRFVAVPPDALAITFVAQAPTTLGALSITPTAMARALAVIGAR